MKKKKKTWIQAFSFSTTWNKPYKYLSGQAKQHIDTLSASEEAYKIRALKREK